MTRIRLAAASLALFIAGNAWADLRTFDVDPQYQQEIYSALVQLLQVPDLTSRGRVQVLPSGQILVNADPATLDQVEQVLKAIRANRVVAAPRAELRYWCVLGSRAAVASPPGAPVPSALGPVLAELERLHGDLNFRVLGAATLATESGQAGRIEGSTLDVEQTTFVQGESLNARIGMDLKSTGQFGGARDVMARGEIRVQTTLRRGEFVVLGQSEVVGGGLDGPLFFIVYWPEAQAR
jgi:hypothetical protein